MSNYKFDETRYLRMLAYGVAGSGKTWLTRSVADVESMSPVLVLNASGNPQVMRHFDNIPDIIDIHRLKDFNDPYDFLHRGQPRTHKLVKQFGLNYGGDNPYKTVIIDQISDVQEIVFNQLLGVDNKRIGELPMKRTWDHFNSAKRWMEVFVRKFFALDMHVILTALEYYRETDSQHAEGWFPSLEGTARVTVPAAANMVCRIVQVGSLNQMVVKNHIKEHKTKPTHNIAFFVPHKRYVAKDQLTNGKLTQVSDLTMSKIASELEL